MAFFDFLTGADEAQKEAKKATRRAIAFQREGRDLGSRALTDYLGPGANYAPIQSKLYDLSGINGAQAQQGAFGQFQESPEIQFQREQGEQSAQRAAAAGGQLASGRTLADLSRFGQGLASQSYGDYYNRLRDLYGSALNTATNLGSGLSNVYTGSANNLSNIAMQGGMQQAQYAGQRGGVLGDLLSQGAALAAYAYGAKPGAGIGSSSSSYGAMADPNGPGRNGR